MNKSKPPTPPTLSVFQLLDERGLRAVLRRAAKTYCPAYVERLHQHLEAGGSLRTLAPRAWEPGGNLRSGGYGMAARPLANGRMELWFSVGRPGESSSVCYEVELGPRGGVRYFKYLGFAQN